MSRPAFPYDAAGPEHLWASAFPADAVVDPQGPVKFRLTKASRIASCGSCFAERIAVALQRYGMSYLVREPGPRGITRELAARYGYAPYSARYGNVYSSLQLSQLFERALGTFVPQELPWRDGAGGYRDPFRPRIQPDGFENAAQLEAERDAHLAAVRSLLEDVDVLIVTLGLVDVWCSRADGAAFPRCPGAGIGEFDDRKYEHRRLSVDDNVAELERAIALLRRVNPSARVLLSVSPVHLAATIGEPHIGRASTYAKAVLRVAVETVVRRHEHVDYVASYELATLPQPGEGAYAPDRRHVTDRTAERVVRSFFQNFFGFDADELAAGECENALATTRECDEDELLRLFAGNAVISPPG